MSAAGASRRSQQLWQAFNVYGIDVRRAVRSIRNTPRFARTASAYHRQQSTAGGLPLSWRHVRPFLADAIDEAGALDSEYFYQDWWVAREVLRESPRTHLDIGSRIDGFLSHMLVFREIEFVDVRRVDLQIPGFHPIKGDARKLEMFDAESRDSISCLHALEHFGLGRYGDEIDPRGHERAAAEISRVLARRGYAYVSVPVGRERLEFNGQRVFAPDTVQKMFSTLTLERFCAIDDGGQFVEDADPSAYAAARDACGIFKFFKG